MIFARMSPLQVTYKVDSQLVTSLGLLFTKPSDRMSLDDVLGHPWVCQVRHPAHAHTDHTHTMACKQARVDDPTKPLHMSGY